MVEMNIFEYPDATFNIHYLHINQNNEMKYEETASNLNPVGDDK